MDLGDVASHVDGAEDGRVADGELVLGAGGSGRNEGQRSYGAGGNRTSQDVPPIVGIAEQR